MIGKNLFFIFLTSISLSSCKTVSEYFSKQNTIQYYGGRNFGVVISGPSGVGKTTIVNELIKRNSDLSSSISVTTRKPRKNERDGVDYYFITQSTFNEMQNSGEFLESVSNFNNSYATPINNYYDAIKNKQDIIFVIDSYGMMSMKKNKDIDVLTIFIAPPSMDVLAKRLKDRGSESAISFEKRVAGAQNEMKNAIMYDYVVYNCNLQDAVKMVDAIYKAEKYRRVVEFQK